jgi:hypothetical protein
MNFEKKDRIMREADEAKRVMIAAQEAVAEHALAWFGAGGAPELEFRELLECYRRARARYALAKDVRKTTCQW